MIIPPFFLPGSGTEKEGGRDKFVDINVLLLWLLVCAEVCEDPPLPCMVINLYHNLDNRLPPPPRLVFALIGLGII